MSSVHNAFLDIGFSDADAAVSAWRSDLARIIRAEWRTSGKTQEQLAIELGINQPMLSRIANGRTASISIDKLLRICVALKTRGVAVWGPSGNDASARVVEPKVASPAGVATTFATLDGTGVQRATPNVQLSWGSADAAR
jgi:predicted XRE-type DNA-binding protein